MLVLAGSFGRSLGTRSEFIELGDSQVAEKRPGFPPHDDPLDKLGPIVVRVDDTVAERDRDGERPTGRRRPQLGGR